MRSVGDLLVHCAGWRKETNLAEPPLRVDCRAGRDRSRGAAEASKIGAHMLRSRASGTVPPLQI
jgi:hypothetical protein